MAMPYETRCRSPQAEAIAPARQSPYRALAMNETAFMTPTRATRPAPGPWRREFRATLRLAWPLAAANLLQVLVHAVDVIFVARLGEQALAASSLAIAIFGLLLWALSGLTGAVAPLIAAELGRRRHAVREVRRSVRMGLWLAVGAGLLGMAACSQAERLMLWTGQDPVISAMAGSFMGIIMWAMLPMIVSNVLRIFVSTLDRPIFATLIIAVAIGVSVIANYAFVFGNLGAPALGLEGSAFASVVTSVFILLSYIMAIHMDRRLSRYRIFGNWWRHEWSRLREIARIGTPIALTILAEAGLFSGAAFLMGRIGPSELAGHTIALQIASLAFQIPFGIGQAATIRVGYHFGARDAGGIRRAGWVAMGIAVVFSGVTASIMLFAPHFVLSLYVDPGLPRNAALVGFAVQYLLWAAIFQLVDAAQAVAAGNLRGLQDTRVPMVIAVLSYWAAGYSVAIWLGLSTPLEGTGVWIGLATGLAIAAVFLTLRWSRRKALGLLPQD